MRDLSRELHDEVAAATSPTVVAELAAAFGAGGEYTWPAVVAYHLEIGDEFLACTAVVAGEPVRGGGQLVRFEMAVDGRTLTVNLPLGRVARVAEAQEGGEVTVVVELDADRRNIALEGDGVARQGAMFPAAFILVGSGDTGRLRNFARGLRRAIR